MPGAYAHITLVNLCKETQRLKGAKLPSSLCLALTQNFKYCELGAVSPDYPYLKLGDGGARTWADNMHYTEVTALIVALANRVAALTARSRRIGLTWLLGYVAHVAADMTIHPVVELKVGPYKGHETAHRICEMHQDAHIYKERMNLGGIGQAEHLDSGIAQCVDPNGDLSAVVSDLWRGALEEIFPAEYAANEPKPDAWHSSFGLILDNFAEEGGKLPAFARHVAADCGLMYPEYEEVEQQYIRNIKIPRGTGSYDEVFDHAIKSVLWAWGDVARLLEDPRGSHIATQKGWNLDTGRDDSGQLVFWRAP